MNFVLEKNKRIYWRQRSNTAKVSVQQGGIAPLARWKPNPTEHFYCFPGSVSKYSSQLHPQGCRRPHWARGIKGHNFQAWSNGRPDTEWSRSPGREVTQGPLRKRNKAQKPFFSFWSDCHATSWVERELRCSSIKLHHLQPVDLAYFTKSRPLQNILASSMSRISGFWTDARDGILATFGEKLCGDALFSLDNFFGLGVSGGV